MQLQLIRSLIQAYTFFLNAGRSEDGKLPAAGISSLEKFIDAITASIGGTSFKNADFPTLKYAVDQFAATPDCFVASGKLSYGDYPGFLANLQKCIASDAQAEILADIVSRFGVKVTADFIKNKILIPVKILQLANEIWDASWSIFTGSFAGTVLFYNFVTGRKPPTPCPQIGGVILYFNAEFDCNGQGQNDGYVRRTSAGWQNITGGMDEKASSVRMPAGWSVRLYEHANRGGGKKCLNSTDLRLDDFNYLGNFPNTTVSIADNASSFEVFTTTGCGTGGGTPTPTPGPSDGIEVCDGTNYGAPCKTYIYISNDTCTNLANDGLDNKIESLRFKGTYIGAYEIILYDDNSCGVYKARYGSSSDASTLGMLNNLMGSFRIEQNVPPPTPTPHPSDGIELCENTN